MTPDDDNWHAMTHLPSQLRSSRNRDLDVLGDGGPATGPDLQPVAVFLAQLRGLAERPAPEPSDKLASVLTHGFAAQEAVQAARSASRPTVAGWWRRGALAFGLSAGLSASLVGAAAASDRLPEGAQNVLERLVETVTPFDVRDDQRSAPPAGEDRGHPPASGGQKPEVPPATLHTATSQDGSDSGAAASETGSEADDATARTHRDESGSSRSSDADRQSASDADLDSDDPSDDGSDSDHEAGTAGDGDAGADHEFSEDNSAGAGSADEASPAASEGSGDVEGSGDGEGSGAEPDQAD